MMRNLLALLTLLPVVLLAVACGGPSAECDTPACTCDTATAYTVMCGDADQGKLAAACTMKLTQASAACQTAYAAYVACFSKQPCPGTTGCETEYMAAEGPCGSPVSFY
ncbi:MAG: hypothetical protein QM820_26040 [Minicystis sp.]